MQELKKICPELDVRPNTRYPIHGALYQARGGIARHDAVAWGYARGAHNLGVDIFENCGVDDFIINNNRVGGVKPHKAMCWQDKSWLPLPAVPA